MLVFLRRVHKYARSQRITNDRILPMRGTVRRRYKVLAS